MTSNDQPADPPADAPADAAADVDSAALIAAARANLPHCYAPFSKFESAAVVQTTDGHLHDGVIVENVSLGLAMCPERVAMFSAVAAGRRPAVLALAAPDTDGGLTWPCGACVQVALELGGHDMVVVVGDDDHGPTSSATVRELLPRGPKVDVS